MIKLFCDIVTSDVVMFMVVNCKQHVCYSALYAIARPSVCHTGGSVNNG